MKRTLRLLNVKKQNPGDFSRWYGYAGLCFAYIGAVGLYLIRPGDGLNFQMQQCLSDDADIKQSTLEKNYRHFALLSENEFNWCVLERYLEGMIYLFHNEGDGLNRSWIALFLSNMMTKEKNFGEIHSQIKLAQIFQLMKEVNQNEDALKKVVKFAIRYVQAEKKWGNTQNLEVDVVKLGTDPIPMLRTVASKLYPYMTMTDEFKEYVTHLATLNVNDLEIKINLEKSLDTGITWNRFVKQFNDPLWIRFGIFILGGVATTSMAYNYLAYKLLPETTRWPSAMKKGIYSFPFFLGCFLLDHYASKLDYALFTRYDFTNLQTSAYMSVKYAVLLGWLGFSCSKLRYLVPTFLMATTSQYPSTPVDAMSKMGFAYEKKFLG